MKGKSVTFRPKGHLRERLEKLAEATERSLTWIVEKCIEGHLPALEEKYAEELFKLARELGVEPPPESHNPKAQRPTTSSRPSLRYPPHNPQFNETKDEPRKKRGAA